MKDRPRLKLTRDDVERLMKEDKSPEARKDVAAKVSAEYAVGGYDKSEQTLAEDIIRYFSRDVEAQVRQILSAQLKESDILPHDIAKTLASDLDDNVALPMIEYSKVLTEDDLVQIVKTQSERKQIAVARRQNITARVSDALIDTNRETVVQTLVENHTAQIHESGFQKIVSRFSGHKAIQESMSYRDNLPITVVEKLITVVSSNLQERLLGQYDLPINLVSDIVISARERATIEIISKETTLHDIKRLVDHLIAHHRLTPSLMLRALCTGDMTFFEVALARMASIPLANARVLVHDAGPLGLKSLYEKASLPKNLFRAFRVAIDVYHNTELDGSSGDRQRFMRTMIERILTQVDDISADDLDYLLGKLQKLSDEAGASTAQN